MNAGIEAKKCVKIVDFENYYPDNGGFPCMRKMERKEKPLTKSCQNPVEHTQ